MHMKRSCERKKHHECKWDENVKTESSGNAKRQFSIKTTSVTFSFPVRLNRFSGISAKASRINKAHFSKISILSLDLMKPFIKPIY